MKYRTHHLILLSVAILLAAGTVMQASRSAAAAARADLKDVRPNPMDDAMKLQLDAYITDTMARAAVPGAVVAVVQDGRITYLKAFGVKTLGQPEPMTADTRMMIGSVGKTLTTLMMASLVQDHKMAWTTPVVDLLPTFALGNSEVSDQITMEMLVCACMGIPRRDFELSFNAHHLTAARVIESLRTFPLSMEFGPEYQYNNDLVAAAGYIAALADGGSRDDLLAGYADALRRRVLDPIGMPDTTLSTPAVESAGNYATPHALNLAGGRDPIPLRYEDILMPVAPAGAHWSTATDLAHFMLTLLDGGVTPTGQRLLPASALSDLWDGQVTVTKEISYGLGWFLGRYKGLQMVRHGGNTLGFTSDLALLPEAHLGVVILTNGQLANAFTEAVRYRLFELAFDQPSENDAQFTIRATALDRAVTAARVGLQPGIDPDAVAPYLGAFRNPDLGAIRVTLRDSKLWVDNGEFVMELRAIQTPDGTAAYVTYSIPMPGLWFAFGRDAAGRPVITIDRESDAYTFAPE